MSRSLNDKINPYEYSLQPVKSQESRLQKRPFPYVPILGTLIGGGCVVLGIYMENYSAALVSGTIPFLSIIFHINKVNRYNQEKSLAQVQEQMDRVKNQCDNLVHLINEEKEQL